MSIWGDDEADNSGPSGNGFTGDIARAIKEHMDKTRLDEQEINNVREQKNVERRRINEKQIRAIRNQYRPSGGFLNQGTGNALGAGSLPTKLGT